MPLLHPPLPANPLMDCRLDPTSRSAAEGNNVPGLQPEPGRVVSPIQLGSDTGLYTREAPGKPRGGIVVSLPTAPWHTPVRRHRNPCPGLPGEPLLPEPGKGTGLLRLKAAASGRGGCRSLCSHGLRGGRSEWVHSCPLHRALPRRLPRFPRCVGCAR